MTDKSINTTLNKLKTKLNTAGRKAIPSTFIAASMFSLSQEAQSANNNTDEKRTKQDITEQSLDGIDSSQILRKESNGMSKKMWSHKIDLGDGYSIIESSVTLSGNEGHAQENIRMLIQPDGKDVNLNFLEIDKFITPSKQTISSEGNVEENFDDGLTRSQAEKENLKILASMRKQLDEKLDKPAAKHAFSYVQSCLNKQMNQLVNEKASTVSNQIIAKKNCYRR